ncbi:hypothetical protein [Kitasatospora sp. NPDC085879]|uniref:hypothetical protein n=1 Tax=Kitasatospora sp. NPDC085879 TaxID=3154769 RepID=UPI003424D1EB
MDSEEPDDPDTPPDAPISAPLAPTGMYRFWLKDVMFPHLCDDGGGWLFPCQRTADLYGRITVDVMRPDGIGRPGGYTFILADEDNSGHVEWNERYYRIPKYVTRNTYYRFSDAYARLVTLPNTTPGETGHTKTGYHANWADLPVAPGDVVRFRVSLRDYDSFGDDNICVGTRVTAPVTFNGSVRTTTFTFRPDDETECHLSVEEQSR